MYANHEDILTILPWKTAWKPSDDEIPMTVKLNLEIDTTEVDVNFDSIQGESKDLKLMVTSQIPQPPSTGHGNLPSTSDASLSFSPSTEICDEEEVQIWKQKCHLVVLDNVFDETIRRALYDHIAGPSVKETDAPPDNKWERLTSDGPNLPLTLGAKDEVL